MNTPPPFFNQDSSETSPKAPSLLGLSGGVPAELADGYSRLCGMISGFGGAVTAFSGGVDSTLVAFLAHRLLDGRALAVTSGSASLPRRELAQAEALAQGLGLAHRVIQTGEMNLPAYRENSADRCYHCKTTLYADLASLAVREGYAVVLSGTHVGDLADHRPGLQAAKKYGVRSPLAECGLDKTQVRLLAQTLGLPNAHKPQAACLASRLPFGRGVSPQGLAQVEQAEEALLALGFTQVRVRHHGPVARVEIPLEQLALALAVREQLVAGVKQAGFGFVALDLDGFRSGSLNP